MPADGEKCRTLSCGMYMRPDKSRATNPDSLFARYKSWLGAGMAVWLDVEFLLLGP